MPRRDRHNKTERSRISIVSFYNLKAVRNSAKAAIAAQGRTEAKRSHSFTCSRQSLGNESGSQSRMAELIRAVPGNVTKAQMSKASSPVTRKAGPRSEPPKTVTATADTSVGCRFQGTIDVRGGLGAEGGRVSGGLSGLVPGVGL